MGACCASLTIVNQLALQRPLSLDAASVVWKMATATLALLIIAMVAHAQGSATLLANDKAPLIIEGVESGDVFGVGRSVIIRGTVKHGAIAFGGDVEVVGTVEGDVAAIGGSVIQREGSHIGGDVLVIGGAYHHGKTAPGRDPSKTTLMYAGYEQELRSIMRDPASLLTPGWSPVFVGLRLLAILFWFVVSLALTAAMPGTVSRAMARLQLTSLRVALIGFLASVVIALGVPACLMVLPTPLSTFIGIMTILLLVVAALFGRVVIFAATGRWLQRRFFPSGKHSESVALLLGVGFWVIVSSLPYVWPLATAVLLVMSLGLALTARYRVGWKQWQDT